MTPQSNGNLIAKLLASSALVVASGAYAFLQQAPAGKAGMAAPAIVTHAEKPATPAVALEMQPAPASKPAATKAPEQSVLVQPAAPAREQAPEETQPPADAAAPPPEAQPPAAENNVAAAARPGLADGDYTGDPADCQWGTVQVEIRVQGGAVAQVNFLQVPDHRRRSAEISDYVTPYLAREAIKAQNDNVDLISGATATSYAFQHALSSALEKAKT